MNLEVAAGGFAVVSGIICAKWALELGFSQPRQILWGVAGLFAGPLVLLILYARLVRAGAERANGRPRPADQTVRFDREESVGIGLPGHRLGTTE
jgi:hypothetical protein